MSDHMMEQIARLHPFAQVVAILVTGAIVVAIILGVAGLFGVGPWSKE